MPLSASDLLVLAAGCVAGGLGWGLRGQIGHEIGAMGPGALVGLVLAGALRRTPNQPASLLVAGVFAAALSIGGNMTYGQTLGLCHGPPGQARYWWGIVGCSLKGGAWWGLAALLTFSLLLRAPSSARLCLVLAVLAGAAVGYVAVNQPFRPPHAFPRIYFSLVSDEPGVSRHETWGALWGALLCGTAALAALALTAFPQPARADLLRAAAVFIGAGVVGGGTGFAIGEALQAWGGRQAPFGPALQPWIDWWKVMEVTFGLIAGLAVTAGWMAAIRWMASAPASAPPAIAAPWPWLPRPTSPPPAVLQAITILALSMPYLLWPLAVPWAERIVDIPVLCGTALSAVAATSTAASGAVGFVLPTLAWALNVASKWAREAGILSPRLAVSAALAFGLAVSAIGHGFIWPAAASSIAAPPSLWPLAAFYGAAWVVLTWLKTLAPPTSSQPPASLVCAVLCLAASAQACPLSSSSHSCGR